MSATANIKNEELQAFEALPDRYLILSTDLTILTASDPYIQATHTSREDIIGKDVFEVFPDNPKYPGGKEEVLHSFRQVLSSGRKHKIEMIRYDVRDESGQFLEKHWTALNTPVFDDHAEIKYIIHKVEDVTELVKNRQKIKELTLQTERLYQLEREARREVEVQRTQLFSIFMQIPAIISVLRGPDLIIELANPYYCHYLNCSKKTIDKPLSDKQPGVSTEYYRKCKEVYHSAKQFIEREIPLPNPDPGQDKRYFDLVYEPIFDHKGNVERVMTFGYEVTDMVNARAQLIELNKNMENFVYTVSHDLKTPLNNLDGLVSMLRESISNSTDEAKQGMDLIDGSVKRLHYTLNDLIKITKSQLGENKPDEKIDVKEVFEEVKADISSLAEDAKAIIKENFELDMIKYQKANFKSILFNLLSNALKYRSPDRQPIVEVSVLKKDDKPVVLVKDNGLGLTRKQQRHLFSRFERFHDHVEGTGLGLYTIKRIVDGNGGKIDVESTPGKGSLFKVYLY